MNMKLYGAEEMKKTMIGVRGCEMELSEPLKNSWFDRFWYKYGEGILLSLSVTCLVMGLI